MNAPATLLGLTRWEFEEQGIRFRIWTRPILHRGGREVVPFTLVWRGRDGSGGLAACGSFVEAMERAAQLAARDHGAAG